MARTETRDTAADPATRRLLSGNEAIARGCFEAGLRFAAAYPGTPSTEILESLAAYPEVTSQWAVNEKTALESAIGASSAGVRSLAAMKHVGLNVAADPLMTASITGVGGGLLIVTADDPGMASSQNEQDNRHYARAAGVPMLEPADSQECLAMARTAFGLSESFDLPFLLRTTTPINHGKGLVDTGRRTDPPARPGSPTREKWVMLPAIARRRLRERNLRLRRLELAIARLRLHRLDAAEGPIGIVTSGVCYQHVKEALPQLPVLKLGLSWPLSAELLRTYQRDHPTLLVIEELHTCLQDGIMALGIPARGARLLPREGPIDAADVARAYLALQEETKGAGRVTVVPASAEGPAKDAVLPAVPERPPALCPGCPYRGVFRALKRQPHPVFGDIGCYTLGALPPHDVLRFTLCMGASIGAAAGYAKASGKAKAIAVIGDSTLLHSGMTGLLDAVYNQAPVTVVILDNCAIAMTGGQGHPGTGERLDGSRKQAVDYEALVRSLGVRHVDTVDPYLGGEAAALIEQHLARSEPTVLVASRPCVLKDPDRPTVRAFVDPTICTGCLDCLAEGCPAIVPWEARSGRKIKIDGSLCIGCPDCQSSCEPGAIALTSPEPFPWTRTVP